MKSSIYFFVLLNLLLISKADILNKPTISFQNLKVVSNSTWPEKIDIKAVGNSERCSTTETGTFRSLSLGGCTKSPCNVKINQKYPLQLKYRAGKASAGITARITFEPGNVAELFSQTPIKIGDEVTMEGIEITAYKKGKIPMAVRLYSTNSAAETPVDPPEICRRIELNASGHRIEVSIVITSFSFLFLYLFNKI